MKTIRRNRAAIQSECVGLLRAEAAARRNEHEEAATRARTKEDVDRAAQELVLEVLEPVRDAR
eukprot:1394422-Pleurochrysis_carterae.AAC.1